MKPMTLCKFNYKDLPSSYHSMYPFTEKDNFIYLGDIENMVGHCVVIETKSGRVFSGYHTEQFIELTDDEI